MPFENGKKWDLHQKMQTQKTVLTRNICCVRDFRLNLVRCPRNVKSWNTRQSKQSYETAGSFMFILSMFLQLTYICIRNAYSFIDERWCVDI